MKLIKALLLAGVSAGLLLSADPPQQQVQLLENPLQALRELEPPADEPYRLGPGDEVFIEVLGRAELTGRHTVGPDGRVTLPAVGVTSLAGMTREDAAQHIAKALSSLYSGLVVTLRVDKYSANRILLLGRVAQPGVLYFERPPTLLEVLTRAGPMPASEGAAEPLPQRCAIYRGRDRVFWLDMRRLLNEASALADVRLRANDIVYVPGDQDDFVSVLGEVHHPGAIKLRRETTITDVLAMAGGLTDAAATKSIRLIHRDSGKTMIVALDKMLTPENSLEAALRRGDIIYVPRRNLAKVGYVLQQFGPGAGFAMFAAFLATN
jgi:polysaccharide export outer membrane protein